MTRTASVLVMLAALAAPGAVQRELLALEDVGIRAILRHGPWPQAVLRNPSNRVG